MQRRPLIDSFRDAFAGIAYVIRTQRNMRIHIAAAVLVVLAGAWLRISALDWGVILLTIAAVVIAEIVNTVVEAIVDLLSPEWHPRAKVAKDAAAGAVCIIAIVAVAVGICVLGPHLWERFGSMHK